MKKVKKTMILLGTMLASVVGGICFMTAGKVEANADTLPDEGKVLGAAIRFAKAGEDSSQNGIRFDYLIDKADVTGVDELGFIIARKADVSGDLTVSTTNAYVAKYYVGGQLQDTDSKGNSLYINYGTYDSQMGFSVDENGTQAYMSVYVYGIPDTAYEDEFVARGYTIATAGASEAYTNQETRSYISVAAKANNDDNFTPTDEQATILSSLLEATITYNTNGGSTVVEGNTEKAVYGKTIASNPTTELTGYEFAGWLYNDTAIDLATFTVPAKSVTLNATFKATGEVEELYPLNDITLEYTGEYSKVTLGDSVIANAGTGEVAVAKANLSNGTQTVKVYKNDYVWTEYVLSVIDTTQPLDFVKYESSSFKAVHRGGDQFYNPDIITEDVQGKSGTFVKVEASKISGVSEDFQLGLKMKPSVSKDVLQLYSTGYLVFDYYVEAGCTTANVLSDGDACHIVDNDTITLGTWYKKYIPVSTLLGGFQKSQGQDCKMADDVACVFDSYVAGFDDSSTNWGKLFWLMTDAANNNGVFYVGNIRLINTLEDADFVEYTSSSFKAVHRGGGQSYNPDIITQDVHGKSGSFVKVEESMLNVSNDTPQPGLKVKSAVTTDILELYRDGYLAFDYYVESGNTEVRVLSDDDACNIVTVDAATLGQWYTVYIPVTKLLGGYDCTDGNKDTDNVFESYVAGFDSSDTHWGKLFWLKSNNANDNAVFYVGNIRLTMTNPNA